MIRATLVIALLGILAGMIYNQLQVRDKLANCPVPILEGGTLPDSVVRANQLSCSFQGKCLVHLRIVASNLYQKECR